MDRTKGRGMSLAKGPVGLAGVVLLAYGITAIIFGGQSFATSFPDGTVGGEKWIWMSVNGWTSVLFIGAGALLLLAAQGHAMAKAVAMLEGLVFAAMCVFALVDGRDVLGIFRANTITALVFGGCAVVLLMLAALGRVGRRRTVATEAPVAGERRHGRFFHRDRTPVAH
jgi:hypothetical protein